METPWYTLKLPQLARAWLLSHPGPSGFWDYPLLLLLPPLLPHPLLEPRGTRVSLAPFCWALEGY